ncbi:MAG: hypothetical protein ACYTFV_05160 [Planctomycetota bacterium]|jgi:hypothetical protein
MKTYLALSASLGATYLLGFEPDQVQSLGSSCACAFGALCEQARAYLDPQILLSALSGLPTEVPRT